MHQRRITTLLVAVPLLLAAGCTGGDGQPVSSASSTASSSSAATTATSSRPSDPASPTDEAPPASADFPADTSDDGGPAQAGAEADPTGQAGGVGLRLATHAGYTRLVIDLNANGVPAWTVRYTEASGPGGGPVDIAGDAFLRVSLQTGTEPSGQGESRVRSSPGPISEVLTTGYFEGSEEVLIGVTGGQMPFRAFALTDPGRIVIDVRSVG
jgi:hypothetical protein